MKAMLLAAGEGRRMQPLTDHTPKPALPVLGRPLLMQKLQRLAAAGVDEVVVNVHHLPDAIRSLVREFDNGTMPKVHVSDESDALLGTGGGLRRAAELLRGDGPIVVMNSDFLSDISLRGALEAHHRGTQQATLVVAPPRDGYSTIDCDETGFVRSLGEPPADGFEPFLFTGCHVIDESVLDRIPTGSPSDIVRDVYRDMAREGMLGSLFHEGFWWEFGEPRLYLEGTMRLLDLPARELRGICPDRDPIRRVDDATAAVGAGVEMHDSARFAGRVALGYASHIGAGAVVENSVIMPEAWIGPGAVVRDSIVAAGVELPAESSISGELACLDEGSTRYRPLHAAAR